MKIIYWILRFYPPQWRERYEQEMLSVLEEHHITLLTVFDLLFGALDARLDPYYRSEKNFFVPQSVQATALIFVAILAIATFLLDRWQAMLTTTFSIALPAGAFAVGTHSYSITGTVLYGEYLLLFVFTSFIMVNIVKKAHAARRRGTVIAAVVCVLLPVLLTSLYAIAAFRAPTLIFITGTVSTLLLLLLTACSLFTFLVKLKETLAVPQKRLLFLIMSLVLFVSFGFYFFYPHMDFSVTLEIPTGTGVRFLGMTRLVPFVSIGTLMLTIGTEGNRWWKMRARLTLLATVLAVGIVGNLIAVFAWYVNFWTVDAKSIYGSQEPSVFILVALAATSILLLFLLLRGWMLATSKQSVTLPQEQQISH